MNDICISALKLLSNLFLFKQVHTLKGFTFSFVFSVLLRCLSFKLVDGLIVFESLPHIGLDIHRELCYSIGHFCILFLTNLQLLPQLSSCPLRNNQLLSHLFDLTSILVSFRLKVILNQSDFLFQFAHLLQMFLLALFFHPLTFPSHSLFLILFQNINGFLQSSTVFPRL